MIVKEITIRVDNKDVPELLYRLISLGEEFELVYSKNKVTISKDPCINSDLLKNIFECISG